jgi:hypothetical protein
VVDHNADFTAANKERKRRVIAAILDFSWDDYGLNEVAGLANEVQAELAEDGESNHMEWAEHLADAVMLAARPISLADLSNQDGKV